MARRLCVLTLLVAARLPAQQTPAKPALAFEEVMIPVRDGVHLQTAILTPTDKTGPLPILFRRRRSRTFGGGGWWGGGFGGFGGGGFGGGGGGFSGGGFSGGGGSFGGGGASGSW